LKNTAKNRVEEWVIARPQRLSVPFTLAVLLIWGVLLLQAGCQHDSSDAKLSVAKAEQTPAGTAPVVNKEPLPQSMPQEEPPQPQTQTAGDTPKIEFKAMAQDFGDVGPETAHTTKFEFKNVGSAPLKIAHVQGCCGSVVRGVQDGQEFAPGESGVLEVEYRSSQSPRNS